MVLRARLGWYSLGIWRSAGTLLSHSVGVAHPSGAQAVRRGGGLQARDASPDRGVLHCQQLRLGGLIKPSITLLHARYLNACLILPWGQEPATGMLTWHQVPGRENLPGGLEPCCGPDANPARGLPLPGWRGSLRPLRSWAGRLCSGQRVQAHRGADVLTLLSAVYCWQRANIGAGPGACYPHLPVLPCPTPLPLPRVRDVRASREHR